MNQQQMTAITILDKAKMEIEALFSTPSLPEGTPKPLGRIADDPAKYAKRFMLTSFLTPTGLPTAPAEFDLRGAALPMGTGDYGNNVMGDCVEAYGLHDVQYTTNLQGRFINPTQACGLIAYEECTGYVPPGVGPGTSPLAFYSYWRKTGLPIMTWQPPQIMDGFTGHIVNNVLTAETNPQYPVKVGEGLVGSSIPASVSIKTKNADGTFNLAVPNQVVLNVASEAMSLRYNPPVKVIARDKINGYAFINHTDKQLFLDATYAFLGSALILNMPKAWQGLSVWDAPPSGHENDTIWNPGGWGGHEVRVIAITSNGVMMNSWGSENHLLTWNAFSYSKNFGSNLPQIPFVDQIGVRMSNMMLDQQTLKAPDGLDWAAFTSAIAALGGSTT